MEEWVTATGRRRLRSLIVGVALVAAACGPSAASPAPASPTAAAPQSSSTTASAPASQAAVAATRDEVCAKGAEEGKAVYWGAFDDTLLKVVEKFNEVYPQIAMELNPLTGEDAATRMLAEAAAGRKVSHDIQSGSLAAFLTLVDRGIITTDIDWKTLGVPDDRVNELNLVRLDRSAFGLAFNSDKLTAEELPNTYEELLDPKWKGRVSSDPRGRPFNTLAKGWGKEKTIDYVTRLKEILDPLIIRGETANLTAVAAGEVDISTSGRTPEVLEFQAQDAPIDRKFLDVVGTVDNYNFVLTDAEHPNAARCFVTWYATDGAQYGEEFRMKANDKIPPGVPDGIEVFSADTAEDTALEAEMSEALGKILTGE